jgi:nucleoside phosphorylase
MAVSSIIDDLAYYIQLRKKTGERRYHLLLVHQSDMQCSAKGYLALARLIRENYFSTILTIGCEDELEQAWMDLTGEPSGYRKLVVGQDADESIVDALDGEGSDSCVVVLDLLKHQKDEMGEGRVTTYLTPEIREGLQRYLNNQEIIIAGSIEPESELLSAFQPQKENVIYYILPAEQTLRKRVSAILGQRGKQPVFIPEPYNMFDDFFGTLLSILIPDSASTERKIHLAPTVIPAKLSTAPIPLNVSSRKKLRADLLLVTVTPVETEAILAQVSKKSGVTVKNRAYHDLDVIGNARTFLVQLTAMGSSGSGGSLKTIEAAIQALSPWGVIMVGIAFGFDPVKQLIGDILISQQIQGYDLERVGSASGSQLRGPRVNASPLLLSTFITNRYYVFDDWPDPPKIHPGLILSGSKLVDNKEFRDQLQKAAPDAVGGEMEGMGLYEAASNRHVEWLMVKAISDWGDGQKHVNKKEYQLLAAGNAARFAIKVIERSDFTRSARR